MTYPDFTNEVLTAADMDRIGLWRITSAAVGTAVTTVNVTNAFSSDFENYRITYSGGTGSTNISLTLKLGASTTGYYNIVSYATYAAATTPVTAGDNNASVWNSVGYAGANFSSASFDLIGPNLAKWTTLNAAAWSATTAGGTTNGVHQVATAYTDFTLGVNTGTITGGRIFVYGYNKIV